MYGISQEDIDFIDAKISYQIKFLKNFSMDFGDVSKNMLEHTYSANINPKKYFAEINNRVNTMVNNAKDKGLKPVFITITAPSQYHEKYPNGDFKISPNETAKSLTQIWNNFTNLQVFQRMKKDGHKLTYFRVYEPHKSGVPHLHALLFLPVDYILEIKDKFYEYFQDKEKWGANKGGIGFRYTWYKEKGGAVGYVMKYILKTFKDENSKSIEHAVYWYIKHRVRRFLSSRSLAPLTLYRKIRYYFKEKFDDDFKKVSQIFESGTIHRCFNDTMISYIYFDPETGEVEEEIIWSKSAELLLNKKTKNSNTKIKLKYQNKQNTNIPVYFDNTLTHIYNSISKKTTKIIKKPYQMTNIQLYRYYLSMKNSEDTVLKRVTHNECIKRGLIDGQILSLNIYERI